MADGGHSRETGAEIRAKLDHPVVDGDAHIAEVSFVLLDYVKQVAGADMAKAYEDHWANRKLEYRPVFWAHPSGKNSYDRATIMLPKLYAERLDECGIDFGLVYSTHGLGAMHIRDNDLRRAGHRALNTMFAEIFKDVADRLTPVAAIPCYTPEEAIEELEYAVNELGLKAIMVNSEIRLPNPVIAEKAPELADATTAIYPMALDALHNFDPFWAKCVELKVAPACHTKTEGCYGVRSSPSSYIFNHLGSFSSGNDYFARSLFLGGVTRRFPDLNFGFLEGGVHWASALYNGLIEHFEKRSEKKLRENLDPSKVDLDLMCEMFDKYGEGIFSPDRLRGNLQHSRGSMPVDFDEIDEFRFAGIETEKDIYDLFVPNFYFGCEGDDRLITLAFDQKLNHFDARLKAMFGSDIGHWDVPDITRSVNPSYDLVEDGIITQEDFRDFVYVNPVMMHAEMNPDFFKGTAVESAVDKLLAEKAAA